MLQVNLRGYEILVIDDDPSHVKLVKKIFENSGAYVSCADDLSVGIDLIEKLSNKGTHDLHFIYLTKGKKNKYKLVCKKIKNKITTSEMNALFEEAILTAPELYSWEYKKFKKPRTTSANIY